MRNDQTKELSVAPSTASSDSPARFIVCGGRYYNDAETIFHTLDALHETFGVGIVFHGNARGADHWANEWALSRGVKVFAVPAEWSKHGRSAGPKRNAAMLGQVGSNGIVLAFPGGRGTADMVKRAKAAGVHVITVEANPGTARHTNEIGAA